MEHTLLVLPYVPASTVHMYATNVRESSAEVFAAKSYRVERRQPRSTSFKGIPLVRNDWRRIGAASDIRQRNTDPLPASDLIAALSRLNTTNTTPTILFSSLPPHKRLTSLRYFDPHNFNHSYNNARFID